jgi:DNA-binding response OmpR family regulator
MSLDFITGRMLLTALKMKEIMVHIRHLRKKMNDSAEHPKYIKTVWGGWL